MATYTVALIIKDENEYNIFTDLDAPELFNPYIKIISYFKDEVLEKELPKNEHVTILLLPNKKFRAIAKDGRVFICD